KQQMDDVMGKVTIDSILLAKEHNYLLLSDETIVRSVAANDYDVSSISSYILWDYFYISGCIDDNLFCEVAAALVCRNYKSLPISAQSLLITLKWSDYKNQVPFTNALNSLDESCAEDSVIQVSAIFFHLLIMEDLKENQDIIIHSVLDRIIQGRNAHQILTKAAIAFCLRYGQNEIQKKLLLQIIVDYGLKIGVFKNREH
ncbi:MAG TPA: hypothetical protein VL092_05270, partial [Chitinophagaceae bacterium]|nr:hypothetical protein [Chitinophagaceae bacterium]